MDDDAARRVAAARVGRLATAGADGRPHVVPICFVLDGDTLYTAVDEKPKRTRALRRLRDSQEDPRGEVGVDNYQEDRTKARWGGLGRRARLAQPGQDV